jgi:predicted DNA-binding antitoxin AbrB/MazE fold protein
MMTELMAFWKYDRFPYLLCGTITSTGINGYVRIKEYGNGSFKPEFILNMEEGQKLKTDLMCLEIDHLARINDLRLESNKKLAELTEKFY